MQENEEKNCRNKVVDETNKSIRKEVENTRMVNDTPKEQDDGFQEVQRRKNDRKNSGIVIREPNPSKLTNENLSVV